MTSKRKQYTSEFKFKAVMESFQRDTTIEAESRKFDVKSSVMSRWRQEFQQNGPAAFEGKKQRQDTPAPGESPEELKKIIGELTVQNELLKNLAGCWAIKHPSKGGTGPPDLCAPRSPHRRASRTG
jgi:transposase-like protein